MKIVNIKDTDDFDVYIGRGSKWGNPFPMKKQTLKERDRVIALYKEYLLNNESLLNSLHELEGKTLGCHCKPFKCHGDILIEEITKRRN